MEAASSFLMKVSGEGVYGDDRTDKHPLNSLQALHANSWQHQIWGLGMEEHNFLIK